MDGWKIVRIRIVRIKGLADFFYIDSDRTSLKTLPGLEDAGRF
jgi:hypothetical protein